jgi:hypothetical protein
VSHCPRILPTNEKYASLVGLARFAAPDAGGLMRQWALLDGLRSFFSSFFLKKKKN